MTYYYKIRACDDYSNVSAYSAVVNIAAYGIANPENVSATLVDRKPHIEWSDSEDATYYEVYRSTKSGSGFNLVGIVIGTSFTDEAALTGLKTYYYKVRACDDYGSVSAFSAVVNVVAYGIGKPENVAVKLVNGKPKVTWSAAVNATTYNVYRSTKSGSGYKLVGTVSGTSFTDTSALTADTTYYYKIRACDNYGNTGAYSSYVSIVIPAKTCDAAFTQAA